MEIEWQGRISHLAKKSTQQHQQRQRPKERETVERRKTNVSAAAAAASLSGYARSHAVKAPATAPATPYNMAGKRFLC